MSKKTASTGAGKRLAALDPTLPSTTVTLDGVEYRLCFDLGGLAEAEKEINAHGVRFSFSEDLEKVTQVIPSACFFAAGLRRFQPEITFAEGFALVRPANFLAVCSATSVLLAKALRGPEPDASDADPTPASDPAPQSEG